MDTHISRNQANNNSVAACKLNKTTYMSQIHQPKIIMFDVRGKPMRDYVTICYNFGLTLKVPKTTRTKIHHFRPPHSQKYLQKLYTARNDNSSDTFMPLIISIYLHFRVKKYISPNACLQQKVPHLIVLNL